MLIRIALVTVVLLSLAGRVRRVDEGGRMLADWLDAKLER
jgi:hypothetical protein